MDIGALNSQQSNMLSYTSNFNEVADAHNNLATQKMNTTIGIAKAKQTAFGGVDKGSAGFEGGTAFLSGAKEYSSARNFDSDIAGFGQGKGFSGYMKSQGQIVKGRMAQGSLRTQQALGIIDQGEYKAGVNNPAKLGLSSNTFEGSESRVMGRDTSGIEFGGKDLDTGKKIASSAQGKSIAKASGGLLGEAGAAEGGAKGAFLGKAGKFITDMPASRLGAVADVGGKALGVIGAGKGIYDLASGSDKTTGEKTASGLDIAAGGLDMLALAMPALAPVAALASGASAIDDYYQGKEKETSAVGAAHKTNVQTPGESAPTLAGSGLAAQKQVSAY